MILGLHPPGARDETQGLYGHRKCLVARLLPTIPLHPDLEAEEGESEEPT